MRHYSELELLDEVYLPGESPMSDHLAACASCRARLAELTGELESIRGEFDARLERKPDAFWESQRTSVMRRLGRTRETGFRQFGAWALAASLVVAIGGGWILRERANDAPRPARPVTAVETPAAEPADALQLPTADPWAADELAGWEQAVAWESWLEPGDLEQGDA